MHQQFRALALADLHLGCPRLDPLIFQACIEEYVIPRITREISHVFISGDFFDLLINMSSIASLVATSIISRLKQVCFENGVKLRVLRGTHTHERNQTKHFLVSAPQFNDCVRLFEELAIEYDESTGMHFLYIPDNLKYADINEEVEKLLQAHALKSVDVVIHHGYFKHMLPPGIPEPSGTLDYNKFCKFFTGCVLNGHVHVRSIYNNVVSIGSFDRMAYGEEEAKGFYQINREDNGVYTFEFIENKHAQLFVTIDIREFSCDDLRSAIDWVKQKLPARTKTARPIHVRLLSDDTALVEGVKTVLMEEGGDIIVDRGATTKREQLIENLMLDLSELVEITPDNLQDLLLPIIQKQHPEITPEEVKLVLDELKGTK